MNLITYFFLGLLTTIIGALPLGTTNVAVINTTIKENIQSALKIVYSAALAEMILVIVALNFNMQIENFIGMNIILLLGRKECIKNENEECIIIKKRRYNPSKQVLGFILGLVNPTVLIYWILVISFLRKKMIHLDISLEYSLLGLFLVGVFLGKVLTLYGYGKFSHTLKLKMKNITTKINRVIGILLVVVSLFQFAKIFFY